MAAVSRSLSSRRRCRMLERRCSRSPRLRVFFRVAWKDFQLKVECKPGTIAQITVCFIPISLHPHICHVKNMPGLCFLQSCSYSISSNSFLFSNSSSSSSPCSSSISFCSSSCSYSFYSSSSSFSSFLLPLPPPFAPISTIKFLFPTLTLLSSFSTY